MRSFDQFQVNVFLNAFGEPMTLTSGQKLTVIFEQETVGVDTDSGIVETQEHYFTTATGKADYSDTFIYRNTLQEIYNIVDDLSGMSNYYFRNHE
ncbi:hypothetical protein [Pantoea agglomerans]|uniref:hypothetical protein n=1 Tax=Enterobacter agglomerans TaxID=549 RepID=UPI0007E5A43B|nr:hypothetical protein [Pantoea agglomerans]WHU86711.1 hypothetical protein A7P62_12495 [Pantoea agglomerans pv. gypsophilae]